MGLNHEGTVRIFLGALAAALFSVFIAHMIEVKKVELIFQVDEFFKALVAEFIVCFAILFVWSLIRTVQHNSQDIAKIVWGLAFIFIVCDIGYSIISNIKQGNTIEQFDMLEKLFEAIRIVALVVLSRYCASGDDNKAGDTSWVTDKIAK